MSSIAYVTDEKMIEYHRLCGNRQINFWRLTSRKEFKDFHPGELLFFYTHPRGRRKKGFVGYAHYATSHTMSLDTMWKRYGNNNGYDTIEQMEEAIRRAAKDKPVPEKMNCLQLDNVVFFLEPVFPEDVGLTISPKMESYCYLDQEDPETTIRILKQAEKNGIDIWSASQGEEIQNTFRRDELRHQLAWIQKQIGKTNYNDKERALAQKLSRQYLEEHGGEMIRNNRTDIFEISDDRIVITVPFVSQSRDYKTRRKEFFGKLILYKMMIEESEQAFAPVKFNVITLSDQPEIRAYTDRINHDGL